MAVLLITYDLNREAVRPNITGEIRKRWPSWAKLSESSYAVDADESPQAVYNALGPLLDANDHLYVITLKNPHSGRGPKDVNDWLASRLTY